VLLLNTDLHIADLNAHMSKSQFVRNTITAIQMQLQPNSAAQLSTSDLTRDDSSSLRGGGSDETEMPSTKRSDSITSWNSLTREAAIIAMASGTALNGSSLDANGSSPSIQNAGGQEQNRQHSRAWEADMENLLKVLNIYFCECDLTQTNRKCTMQLNINKSFSPLTRILHVPQLLP